MNDLELFINLIRKEREMIEKQPYFKITMDFMVEPFSLEFSLN